MNKFLNSSLARVAGMQTTQGNAQEMTLPNKCFFRSEPVKKVNDRSLDAVDSNPKVNLGMSDKEIKRRTGFTSEAALLSYIFVVYNGDIETVLKRTSSLTWYEEWFLVFEYI